MRGATRGYAFDAAIDLAAGFGLLVDDGDLESQRTPGRRGSEARGTGADDDDIESGAHSFTVTLPS
jgi:hypothetical protein